jgi:protein-disulfide isomerase
MRHVFMDFPLDMHKNAFRASVAGMCARDQGKFWEMNEKLFNNPTNNPKYLEPENIMKLAEDLGLNMAQFKACTESGKHDAEIKKRMAEGQIKAGITGTPAFLLGYMTSDGKVKATNKIVGARPFASFKTEIDDMLSKK